MNKLWIFGDSYSTYNREREAEGVSLSIYTKLANHLNLIQTNKSISGLGNLDIYNNLLKFLSEYNSGDYIIFQLSFLDRFSYIDELKNRELNAHEMELYSFGERFFLHPQYYYNSNTKNKLSDSQIEAFSNFIKSNDTNLLDTYFKFLIQLKHIVNFLEEKNIQFKLLILENLNIDYNGEQIDFYKLLKDVGLNNRILTIQDRLSIRESRFYLEAGDYSYHHFTLNTIDKYAEALKENFK